MIMKNPIQIMDLLGNKNLLNLNKTAFMCSRNIPASAVLKCYDWAIEQRENGNCVISGFHSKLEKDVFHYLAKGKQPIILALPRGLKTRWEPEIKELLNDNRLLIVTPFESNVKRITKEAAALRNQLMAELADEIVIGYKTPDGNITGLFKQYYENRPITLLVNK